MSSEAITRNDLKSILDAILPSGSTVQLRAVSINFTGSVSSRNLGEITAPTIDGYTFVCWVAVSSLGYVGSPYTEFANQQTTTVWDLQYGYIGANCSVHAWALYVGTTPISDQGMADYIVDQGTEDIWTYRKWNSGIAECWGTRTVSLNINQGFGALYYTTFNQGLPSGLFTAVDSVTATRNGLKGGSGNGLVWISFHSTSTSQLGAYVIDSVSQTQTWSFSFHVIGKWK